MPDSIFTKIIRGDIPCHKVYEDSLVFAFLDVAPLSAGHTLVVPREAKATLAELSDESASAIGRALPRICRAVMHATGCIDYNVLQNNGERANQAVMHVHFHVIPKPSAKSGLGITWPATKLDPVEGSALAAKIASAISAT